MFGKNSNKSSGNEHYLVVQTFIYSNGPLVVPGRLTTKSQALVGWRHYVASGAYGPHSGRRVRVMAESEWLKISGGAQ